MEQTYTSTNEYIHFLNQKTLDDLKLQADILEQQVRIIEYSAIINRYNLDVEKQPSAGKTIKRQEQNGNSDTKES